MRSVNYWTHIETNRQASSVDGLVCSLNINKESNAVTIDRNHNEVFEDRVDFPFWDGLNAGVIRMQRCTGCERWIWPAEWRCGKCGSYELEWQEVPGEGIVYGWGRTHYPFAPEFNDMRPYTNVLVELPAAGGRRVFGVLLDAPETVRVGDQVIADIQPPSSRTQNLPALWWRLKLE